MIALKKIYTTYRLYIFPTVVVLSCLVLIVFIIYPQLSTLLGNIQTEGQVKSKFEIMETKAQTLEIVDEKDLNSKLNLALNIYPKEYDFLSVIGILQNVVLKYGFSIDSLSLGGTLQQSKASDSFFNVKLAIIGSSALLNGLINGIENSSRIMKVNGIEISGIRQNDNANIGLNIGVYYKPIPNTLGSPDSPLPVLSDKEEAILITLAKLNPVSATGLNAGFASMPRGKTNPFE